MRKFKFRVWDKVGKKMYYNRDDELGFDTEYNSLDMQLDMDREDPRRFEIEDEDLIIMQYIGLEDKNGKEIYEGDILRLEDSLFVVRWDKIGTCFIADRETWGDDYYTDDFHSCVIVGNIYENPQLIKEPK